MKTSKVVVADEYSSRVDDYNVTSMATSRKGEQRLRTLIRRGDTVIDIGCGPGFALPMALQFVGEKGKVLAIDISPGMLRRAKENIENWFFPPTKFNRSYHKIRGLDLPRPPIGTPLFLLCDAERLPLKPAVLQVAFAFTSLHRMDATSTLKEAWRVLAPGGYVLMEIPGTHDDDAMVFEHAPPSFLPKKLPRGFPKDFQLNAEYWTEEQESWRRFKAFCRDKIPCLADAISKGWFNGFETLREKYDECESGKITQEELDAYIGGWEEENEKGELGWICFPTRHGFSEMLDELVEMGAIVIESNTSSFKPGISRLLRTKRRVYELFVFIYSMVIRTHTAVLWKPPWVS